MKRMLCFVLTMLLVFSFCVNTSVSFAADYVAFQGFENTSVSVGTNLPASIAASAGNGAVPRLANTFVHSGTYSAKACFSANSTQTQFMGCKFLLSSGEQALFEDGNIYELTSYVYYKPVSSQTALSLRMGTINGTNANEIESVYPTINKEEWTKLTLQFTYDASKYTDGLNIKFVSGAIGSSDNYFIDDIKIEEVSEKSYFSKSRTFDFEDNPVLADNLDIKKSNGASLSVSSDINHTQNGSKSLNFSKFDSSSSRVCLLDVFSDEDIGKDYYVEMYVYPNQTGNMRIGVKGDENSNSYWAQGPETFDVEGGKWNKIVFKTAVKTFTSSGGTVFLTNHIAFDQRDKTENRITQFYVDDIKVFVPKFAPASYFANKCVLQRNKPIPVWGTHDDAGTNITVTLGGVTKSTAVDSNGNWEVSFEPLKAQKGLTMSLSDGSVAYDYTDIAVGEVILCAGQSNMQIRLNATENYNDMKNICENYDIRFFDQNNVGSLEKKSDVSGGTWILSKPDSVGMITGTAYYAAYYLYDYFKEKEDIAIGLLDMAYGGTPIEAWLNEEVIYGNPDYKEFADALESIKKSGIESAPNGAGRVPSACWNAMFYPMRKLPVSMIMWYQGEENAQAKYFSVYGSMFDDLVKMWRENYGDENLNVFSVQLAPYNNSNFAQMREIQLEAAKRNKNVYLIATENEGPNGKETADMGPIHPRNKMPVGYRIFRAAAANYYAGEFGNEFNEWCGPEYDSMSVSGDKAVIKFKHVGTGLKIDDGKDVLTGFEISSDGVNFIPADAKTDGETVIVSADSITNPVSVRYCYVGLSSDGQTLGGNLSNDTDIPAYPFVATLLDVSFVSAKTVDLNSNETTLAKSIKDGIKAEITVKNDGLCAKNASIVVAYYKNNNLCDINTIPIEFATKGTVSKTSKIFTDASYNGENISLKAFVLDLANNVLPLDISVNFQ